MSISLRLLLIQGRLPAALKTQTQQQNGERQTQHPPKTPYPASRRVFGAFRAWATWTCSRNPGLFRRKNGHQAEGQPTPFHDYVLHELRLAESLPKEESSISRSDIIDNSALLQVKNGAPPCKVPTITLHLARVQSASTSVRIDNWQGKQTFASE